MKFWAMKTYKSFLDYFIENKEIGIEEDGVDYSYIIMEEKLDEKTVVKFNRFCKYIEKNDYIFMGYGEQDKFRLKMICKIDGDYRFDMVDDVCRHKRPIEILKIFDEEISIGELCDVIAIENIESREAIDILISRCM